MERKEYMLYVKLKERRTIDRSGKITKNMIRDEGAGAAAFSSSY